MGYELCTGEMVRKREGGANLGLRDRRVNRPAKLDVLYHAFLGHLFPAVRPWLSMGGRVVIVPGVDKVKNRSLLAQAGRQRKLGQGE
jgi:hypothetical protein